MVSIAHWTRRIKAELVGGPLLAEVLSAQAIEEACQSVNHRWRESFWSPSVTVLTFLLQVLAPVKTLRGAVAQLLTQLSALGVTELPSCDPTAYCQARRRLPVEVVQGLLPLTVAYLRGLVSRDDGWRGRRIWVVDGSGVSMPDTPDLQQAFPQPSNQAPGCGFPVARIVTLFCWSTGAIIDLAIGSLRVHELTLWRQLWHHLRSGDVVLGDRSFGSYVDIARLRWRRVHGVFRLHASRKADFRKGDRLGKDDQLVVWQRPAHWTPSCGLTREEFTHVPNEMVVRQIRISDAPKGFRSRTIVVVTTLLDPVEAPADEIRALYRDRWTVELDLRSLKIALGMDVLRAHTVDVVGKELMMHLVAYNLIRVLMWQAAKRHDRDLHSLSFTGTLHRLQDAASQLLLLDRLISKDTAFDYLLQRIAEDVLPDRPGRTEPRCVKRRPKNYRRLTRPRRPSRGQSG